MAMLMRLITTLLILQLKMKNLSLKSNAYGCLGRWEFIHGLDVMFQT
jgi:hypothetical protein